MEADRHSRQAARLVALERYGILDTPRESDFDDIVALASQLCDTPISVVTLVDRDRQWFKAEVGLGIREMPLADSICSHAILEQDFLEIPDTLSDPRTADNPLCTVPSGLRFYAGALLKGVEGLPLGTLCVLDTQPRRLTPLQREALRVLADQVMTQIALRQALREQAALRRESDHRVKNSLAAIGAQIRIKARAAATPEVREALKMVGQRVETVAALHGLLYAGNGNAEVALADYLVKVVDLLRSTAPEGVTLATDLDPVDVPSGVAGSLAIIVNELCTNAFKYAFPVQHAGTVTVTGRRTGGGYALTCADDGAGVSGAAEPGSGIGQAIVEASVGQIGGRMDVRHGPAGVAVTVTVPLPDRG